MYVWYIVNNELKFITIKKNLIKSNQEADIGVKQSDNAKDGEKERGREDRKKRMLIGRRKQKNIW